MAERREEADFNVAYFVSIMSSAFNRKIFNGGEKRQASWRRNISHRRIRQSKINVESNGWRLRLKAAYLA
jgi:hypothetical protein